MHNTTRLYQPWEKAYFVLSAGDVYNMKSRKIEKHGIGATPRRVLRRREIWMAGGGAPALLAD